MLNPPRLKNLRPLGIFALLLLLFLAYVVRRTRSQEDTESQTVKDAPVSFFRSALLERLQVESLSDTINNLALPNDVAPVVTLAFPAGPISLRSYKALRIVIPRLSRVKNILACAEENKALVIDQLVRNLQWSEQKSESADRRLNDALIQARGEPVLMPDSNDYDRCVIYGPSSVYLLSELKAYSVLPMLARLFKSKRTVSVNRVFLLCGIHSLAKTFPRDSLTPEGSLLLERYLVEAKELDAIPTWVPSWNATYDEGDSTLNVLFRRKLDSAKQPQICLSYYPAELEKYEDSGGTLSKQGKERLDAIFSKLQPFIDSVFPSARSQEKLP